MAFWLSGEEWLIFIARLAELGIGEGSAAARVVDHIGAWSVYFTDPFGHRLEVTTYDAEVVRHRRGAA